MIHRISSICLVPRLLLGVIILTGFFSMAHYSQASTVDKAGTFAPHLSNISKLDIGGGVTLATHIAINEVTKRAYIASSSKSVSFSFSPFIAVVDLNTNTLVKKIPIGFFVSTFGGLAVNPVTNKLYIGSDFGLYSYDENTEVLSQVPGISGVGSLAVNPVTNKIYVQSLVYNIVVLDGATDTVTITIEGPDFPFEYAGPTALAVNTVTNQIYLGQPQRLVVIDGNTDTYLTGIEGMIFPSFYSVAVNPVTNTIYQISLLGDIYIFDGATNTLNSSTYYPVTASDFSFPVLRVNPNTNQVYITELGTGGSPPDRVLVFDAGVTTLMGEISGGSSGIALDISANRLCSLSWANSVLSVTDIPTGQTVSRLSLFSSPVTVVVNPGLNQVYTGNANGTYTAINGDTNTVTETVLVADGQTIDDLLDQTYGYNLNINPTTDHLFYALESSDGIFTTHRILVFNATTKAYLYDLPVAGNPEINPIASSIEVNPVTNTLYVYDTAQNALVAIDDVNNTVIGTVSLSGSPRAIVINPVKNQVYVGTATNTVVIDGATHTIVATYPVSLTTSVCFNPNTNRLYTGVGNQLQVIDTVTFTQVATISLPQSTYDYIKPACNVVTNKLYLISDSELVTIDGNTNSVTDSLTLSLDEYFNYGGAGEQDLAVNPFTNQLYLMSDFDQMFVFSDGPAPTLSAPSLTQTFSPGTIQVNGVSTLTFTLNNANATYLSGVNFTDVLPAGVQIASPANLTVTGLAQGTVTATAGATSLSLANGVMAANQSATIAVNVVATTHGVKTNTTSVITSREAGNGAASSATLTVNLPAPSVTQFYPVASYPGKTITVYGANFQSGVTQVFFGGSRRVPAPGVTVVSATELKVVVPPTGTGNQNINGFLTIRVNGQETTTSALPANASNPGLSTATSPEFALWGDINNDGRFFATDLGLALRIVIGQLTPTARQRLAVDVDPLNTNGSRGNGTLNLADHLFLVRVQSGVASF